MEDTFDIPVTYKGKELLFKSQLLILDIYIKFPLM
jgi:hypothetical protein